ncbi:molybdenum cofactor biosynthesis protein A [Roseobacter sp. SK209-2-6]|uniref:molybdopterin molybdotransferase MoeA n=1 Tax=Roseobacter sp. SK209-2-6 TaxID=388739 RepID=UPI0000F3F644|nr:gephyrin-like molybdotransferase Glp [Roseobacter sp. SK209-2-6]EBA17985.1 molybdenum cofactor biosynthesis protein A [Roseobacter sp. SK209-2-6]
MIPVSEARETLLRLVSVLEVEEVPLAEAAGRCLALDLKAKRDQPPFSASAMDGYAVKAAEVERHAMFQVIGEAAAGHAFEGKLGAGQAVRIFTGAPVPEGADFVVIQEDVTRKDNLITITETPGTSSNIRPRGGDFLDGQTVTAPRALSSSDVALLAAMNIPKVPVRRRPEIALISTGDELVMPGGAPGPDQIIASNTFGLKAMFEAAGAKARILPIAKDNAPALRTAFSLAQGADLVVTIGGASVGDHDLVAPVASELGMERAFYKVAMRPGKPLMAGRLNGMAMVGLPGNPVSAMVCGQIFLIPMIQCMLGLETESDALALAPLSQPLAENGPREHYMRAKIENGEIFAHNNQDSSLLSVLAQSNALLVRPPHDSAREVGEMVPYVPI